MNGNLARFNAVGATFNPQEDSATLVMLTTLTDPDGNLIAGFQDKETYIQFPEYSPDGKRIVFTAVQRASGWDGSTGPSDSAEIYVLKNLDQIPVAPFPFVNYALRGLDTTQFFVKITDRNSIRFAWQPHWSRDGSAIFFSGQEGKGSRCAREHAGGLLITTSLTIPTILKMHSRRHQ